MLVIRCGKQSRHSLYPLPLCLINSISTAAAGSGQRPPPLVQESEILAPFKQWFMSRKNSGVDRIFDILRTQDDVDAALCRLNLRLTESTVLDVLQRGDPKRDWHCCMKFFDWAERRNGFQHTPATCLAIFRILRRANQVKELQECLNVFWEKRYYQQVQFHSVMVSGYAMAGSIHAALTLFGRMRFLGLDLDSVSYHVLLNALVEHGNFPAVDTVAAQIRKRGFENGITRAILVKNFCKQKEFDKAEEFIWRLLSEKGGDASSNGVIVATFVDALCKDQQSERADQSMKEVEKLGTVPMERAKNVWMKNIVKARDIDKALDFLKVSKQRGFIPDVFRYNSLLRLSSKVRLDEVYGLLEEMKEHGVVPNSVTMNYALLFFCNKYMIDAALEIYNSRADFGFSVNAMSHSYLLNVALKYANVDDAYSLLSNAVEQDILPGRTVFSDIARKEDDIDKMVEFLSPLFKKDFAIGQTAYHRFLIGLFKSKRWVDGYKLNEKFASDRVTCKSAYTRLIRGLISAGEEPRAVKLFIEMQEYGHEPDKELFREVIRILCRMDNPVAEFHKLFLRFPPTTCRTYNKFIYGAGKERQYLWARKVYDAMESKGIQPDLKSDVLMLQSYMKSKRISDALNFFDDLCMKREVKKKVQNVMVISLCKGGKWDYAVKMFWRSRKNKLKLTIECYEELLKLLFSELGEKYKHAIQISYDLYSTGACIELGEMYKHAIQIIDDLYTTDRRMSSFIGNILLVHAQKSHVYFEYWIRHHDELSLRAESLELIQLMNDFSKPELLHDFVSMEARIGRCFSLDPFTYNLLFQRLMDIKSDWVCNNYERLKKRGIELNNVSYIMYRSYLVGCGRTAEAIELDKEMERKIFSKRRRKGNGKEGVRAS